MFFEISRNSQENTRARAFFLDKVAGLRLNYSDILHYKQASLSGRLMTFEKKRSFPPQFPSQINFGGFSSTKC